MPKPEMILCGNSCGHNHDSPNGPTGCCDSHGPYMYFCGECRNAPAEAPNLDASVTNGAKHTCNHPADSDAAGGDF